MYVSFSLGFLIIDYQMVPFFRSRLKISTLRIQNSESQIKSIRKRFSVNSQFNAALPPAPGVVAGALCAEHARVHAAHDVIYKQHRRGNGIQSIKSC